MHFANQYIHREKLVKGADLIEKKNNDYEILDYYELIKLIQLLPETAGSRSFDLTFFKLTKARAAS